MNSDPIKLHWIDGTDFIVGQFVPLKFRHRSDMALPLLDIGGVTHGFVTDGGSKPAVSWVIAGHPYNRRFPAYLKHDFSWSMRDMVGLTFDEANEELYYDCIACGDSPLMAWLTWKGVQYGGRGIWRRGTATTDKLSWHYAPLPLTAASLWKPYPTMPAGKIIPQVER